VTRMSPEELRAFLEQLFHEADADGSGSLDRVEFKNVLKNVELNLSDQEVKRVLAEADMDGNGTISYEEFLPLAVDRIMAEYARMEAAEIREVRETDARRQAEEYLVHGMDKAEVEIVMWDIFRKSDVDGSGALSLAEFQKCCKDADIGLTRKEINILMHQCDVDNDGTITYEEFVPLCYEMLTEILKDEYLTEARQPSELENFFLQCCAGADEALAGMDLRTAAEQMGLLEAIKQAGGGKIDPFGLKQVIMHMDLGMNRMQVHSVLAAANYSEDGDVDYVQFAPTASEMIVRMLDVEAQLERNAYLKTVESMGVRGMNQGDLTAVLEQEFGAEDTSGSGLLSKLVVEKVLRSSSLQLSASDVFALVSSCEKGPNGDLYYVGLVNSAYFILQYLDDNAKYESR